MKNSYSLISILSSFTILFSNNSYLDNYNNNIRLSIDPFNINTYIIDKFFPTHNLDMNYYSIKFDGSTFIPLYQSMPESLFFDYNSVDDFTQLSYNQNKADSYFDTNIAMKNNIDDNVDYLLQIESKSLVQNINQNLFFNYSKTQGFFDFNISYMYHYETNSENFKLINTSNDNDYDYDKNIESYNVGFSIAYNNENISMNSTFSSQTSSNNRPYYDNAQIHYDSNVFWNDNLISLSINNKSNIYFKNKYKKNIIEYDSNNSNFLKHNIGTFGLSYRFNKVQSDIGFNIIDRKTFPLLSAEYIADIFSIKISLDNRYFNNFIVSNLMFGENTSYISNRANINFSIRLESIENSLDIGNIVCDNYEYNYLLLNGNLKFKKIIFDYKHFSYFPVEDTMIPFKQYSDLNISLYPFKETYEFELYGKLGISLFNMDSNMDLRKLNPFSTENIEFRDISSSYGEIGIIFDSFMISYKSDNILNREIIYSDLIQSFERYDYISIIWTFKE